MLRIWDVVVVKWYDNVCVLILFSRVGKCICLRFHIQYRKQISSCERETGRETKTRDTWMWPKIRIVHKSTKMVHFCSAHIVLVWHNCVNAIISIRHHFQWPTGCIKCFRSRHVFVQLTLTNVKTAPKCTYSIWSHDYYFFFFRAPFMWFKWMQFDWR